MAPAGQKAIEDAKADGRWAAAYESPRNAEPPDDFLSELKKIKKQKSSLTLLIRPTFTPLSIDFKLRRSPKPARNE